MNFLHHIADTYQSKAIALSEYHVKNAEKCVIFHNEKKMSFLTGFDFLCVTCVTIVEVLYESYYKPKLSALLKQQVFLVV